MSASDGITRRTFLQAAGAAAVWSAMPVSLAEERSVRFAPHMPEPRFVDTNGLRMAVYEQGEGVPVVFSHGFPELAFSWRHQMKALSESGFRAIAPDQRGYGLTGGPEDNTAYTIQHLCDDMAGMLDALGIEKAVFCGHDWGGGVVWSMVRLHPDRCLGVIGVNTPSMRPPGMAYETPPPESLIVQSANHYVTQFMAPGRAEAVLEKDVARTFDFFMRKSNFGSIEEFKNLPEDSPERQLNLLELIEREPYAGEPFLPQEALDYFVETFEITGFTGGLNWYRNAIRSFGKMQDAKWEIEVPCLYVGAEWDFVLPPSSAHGMEDFITDFEKTTIAECGHWTQQEKPDELNAILVDWLKRKYGDA